LRKNDLGKANSASARTEARNLSATQKRIGHVCSNWGTVRRKRTGLQTSRRKKRTQRKKPRGKTRQNGFTKKKRKAMSGVTSNGHPKGPTPQVEKQSCRQGKGKTNSERLGVAKLHQKEKKITAKLFGTNNGCNQGQGGPAKGKKNAARLNGQLKKTNFAKERGERKKKKNLRSTPGGGRKAQQQNQKREGTQANGKRKKERARQGYLTKPSSQKGRLGTSRKSGVHHLKPGQKCSEKITRKEAG